MRYEKEIQFIESRYQDVKLTGILRTPVIKGFKRTKVYLYLEEEVLPKFNPKIAQMVFTGVIYSSSDTPELTIKYILPKQ